MIEFLLTLLRESTLLFIVLMVNLTIVIYIIFRIALYITHKKQPVKILSHFFWKIKAKGEKQEIKTIEDVYAFVMEGLRKEKILDEGDKSGFKARKKILLRVPPGEKRAILAGLFGLYESKVYGNRGIRNENRVVADIFDKYSNL